MIIYGVAKVTLCIGDRKLDSEILITPELNGLIIGIDWLAKQGEFVWDFRNQRIKFKMEDGCSYTKRTRMPMSEGGASTISTDRSTSLSESSNSQI